MADSDGPGLGSTLRVRLPRSRPVEVAERPETPGPRTDLSRLKVLIVDDHQASLKSLHHMLADQCQVRAAASGAAGLAEARRFLPDVLLLDLALPDTDGFELAGRIARLPGLEDARQIAMTGFGDPQTAQRVRDAGFIAHLVKPIDYPQLLAHLQAALAEKDAEADGSGSA